MDSMDSGQQVNSERERLLELESEAQELRLQNEELERKLKDLANDLERQQKQAEKLIEQALTTEMQKLVSELAAPIAQLLTQEHLRKFPDNKVTVEDVLVLAQQMIRACRGRGLEIVGAAGEHTQFNANHHEAIAAAETPQEGSEVLIRMSGIAYKGRVLRRALVTL